MAKFNAGDFVKIVPPPANIFPGSCIAYVDEDLVGKIGTVVRERYDPDIFTLYRFTYYEVNVFGRSALCAQFCLVLIPGEPDIVEDEEEKELEYGAAR